VRYNTIAILGLQTGNFDLIFCIKVRRLLKKCPVGVSGSIDLAATVFSRFEYMAAAPSWFSNYDAFDAVLLQGGGCYTFSDKAICR
jgi:hypothetical protein